MPKEESGVDPSQVSPTLRAQSDSISQVEKSEITGRAGNRLPNRPLLSRHSSSQFVFNNDVPVFVRPGLGLCKPGSVVKTPSQSTVETSDRVHRLNRENSSDDERPKDVFEIWRAQSHSFLDKLERSSVGEGEVAAVHHTKKALAKRLDSLYSRFKELEKETEPQHKEAQEAKGVKAPKPPTEAVKEQHALTHLPFEAWCDECVKGRGKEKPHRHVEPGESVIPEIQTDYTFLRSQFDGETDESRDDKITVLTMIKSDTGYGHCTVCESKGTSDRFVTKVFVKFRGTRLGQSEGHY